MNNWHVYSTSYGYSVFDGLGCEFFTFKSEALAEKLAGYLNKNNICGNVKMDKYTEKAQKEIGYHFEDEYWVWNKEKIDEKIEKLIQTLVDEGIEPFDLNDKNEITEFKKDTLEDFNDGKVFFVYINANGGDYTIGNRQEVEELINHYIDELLDHECCTVFVWDIDKEKEIKPKIVLNLPEFA